MLIGLPDSADLDQIEAAITEIGYQDPPRTTASGSAARTCWPRWARSVRSSPSSRSIENGGCSRRATRSQPSRAGVAASAETTVKTASRTSRRTWAPSCRRPSTTVTTRVSSSRWPRPATQNAPALPSCSPGGAGQPAPVLRHRHPPGRRRTGGDGVRVRGASPHECRHPGPACRRPGARPGRCIPRSVRARRGERRRQRGEDGVDPVPASYVQSDLAVGPVLFATC